MYIYVYIYVYIYINMWYCIIDALDVDIAGSILAMFHYCKTYHMGGYVQLVYTGA